jgi:hypothetical protein
MMSRHTLPDVIRAIRDAFEVTAGENGHQLMARNQLVVEAGYVSDSSKYRFTISYLGVMRVSGLVDLNDELPLDRIIARDVGSAIGTVAKLTAPNTVIDEFNKLPVDNGSWGFTGSTEPRPKASVEPLLRNGAPNTLFTNLLELANDGEIKEAYVVTLSTNGKSYRHHWTNCESPMQAIGLIESLKRAFLESLDD